jgi:hypothetical protein
VSAAYRDGIAVRPKPPRPDPLAALLELPGVADAAQRARNAVDRVLTDRVVRRRAGEVAAESALRGAVASARLAGANVELAEVRSGVALDDPVLQGALRAQQATGPLRGIWRQAPRQALARLHAVAAADLVADRAVLGRPASVAESSWLGDRLDVLAHAVATTSSPAVVIAAVVHGEVLSLDAFPPASGVVARAAERLTLVAHGLDPSSVIVVEAGHLELESDYRSAIADYRSGAPDGVARWVRHCADAVTAGAREAAAIATALARMDDEMKR